MSTQLIYHSGNEDSPSPFHDRAMSIARGAAPLYVACPYIGLEYLSNLLRVSKSWSLVSDACAWIASLDATDRRTAADFINAHSDSIRHVSGLHAKVLIGATTAMVGSANLTASGIRHNSEMAVFLDEPGHHSDLIKWFKGLWATGERITPNKLQELIEHLPFAPPRPFGPSRLFKPNRRNASLSVSEGASDIRNYKNKSNYAKGYYTGRRNSFCIMKGSLASGSTDGGFAKHPYWVKLRNQLIRTSVLSRIKSWGDYEFTADYVFDSPSAAACIVGGASKSGPKEWGPKHRSIFR